MRLEAFVGDWEIDRAIEDVKGGRHGRFTGRARFTRSPEGLRLSRGGPAGARRGPEMAATRDYLWRDAGAGVVEVLFADGRPVPPLPPSTSPTRPPSTPARPTPTGCATTSRAGRAGGPSGASPARARTTAWSAASAPWRHEARARRRGAARGLRPATGKRSAFRRAAAADALLPCRPGPAAVHARRGALAASSSSRTATGPSRTSGCWCPRPTSSASRTRRSSRRRSPASGRSAGRSGAPRARAARGARPRDQLGRRPQPEPPAHPRLLRRPRGPRRVRERAHRHRVRAAEPFIEVEGQRFNARRVDRLEPSPFLLLRDLPGAAEDMAGSPGGDGRRRRRARSSYRFIGAGGRGGDRGAA